HSSDSQKSFATTNRRRSAYRTYELIQQSMHCTWGSCRMRVLALQFTRLRNDFTRSTNGLRSELSTRALAIRTGSPKKNRSYSTCRPPNELQAMSHASR